MPFLLHYVHRIVTQIAWRGRGAFRGNGFAPDAFLSLWSMPLFPLFPLCSGGAGVDFKPRADKQRAAYVDESRIW